jgi:hypothetical protein
MDKIFTSNLICKKQTVGDHYIAHDVRGNLELFFPSNLLRVGNGREAVKQRRPSRSAPGVSRGTVNRMGCAACWGENCREKGDVAREGWADVARRLPVIASV